MYTEKQQSSSITVDQAYKTNSSQTKEVKPSHPPTLPLFDKVNSQSLQPLRWRDYRDNWISPKHNFMQHKRVLGCSQFTRCILCLKERPKEKKIRPVFLCFEKDLCSTGLRYKFIPLYEKFLQFDWLRAVVFQLNLKYLHVKITNLLRVVV